MAKLGVNISPVATIRQAWGGVEPDPVWAAAQAELGGADVVTVHLREDRRHIQDRDVRLLRETVQSHFNLEIAPTSEMLSLALEILPDEVTFVAESPEQMHAAGGLDVSSNRFFFLDFVAALRDAGIDATLSIEPELRQVEACTLIGADGVELFAGRFAAARGRLAVEQELRTLIECAHATKLRHLRLSLGHGIHYGNAQNLASIHGVDRVHVGHGVVGRAILMGLAEAVREIKRLII